MASKDRITARFRGVDAELLAACDALLKYRKIMDARFAAWSEKHPRRDLPMREQIGLIRQDTILELPVMSTPAKTLAGARAKARCCLEGEYWSGKRPETVVHALIHDLVHGGGS